MVIDIDNRVEFSGIRLQELPYCYISYGDHVNERVTSYIDKELLMFRLFDCMIWVGCIVIVLKRL